MQDPLCAVEISLLAQVVDDLRIGVLDEHAAIPRLPFEKTSVESHDVPNRDAFSLAELEVRHAVRSSRVHDAGALIHAYQLRRIENDEGEPVWRHVGEERLVGHVHEVTTVHLVKDLVVTVKDFEALFGEDVRLVALRNAHVALAGMHRERDIARERPRRCRPREHERLAVGVVEPELDVHRRIRRVLLVSLTQLVR